MKLTFLFFSALATLFTPASADSSHPFSAPGPDDVRSPCPGLNSLANHGFLPHSGRGMTIPILTSGLADGLNMGADFTVAIGGAGLLSNPHQDLLEPYFDLDMLDEHDFPIEHDFSLSRQDFYFGDNHSFNQTMFDMVLDYVPEGENFTIAEAAKARYNRVVVEKARDPAFTYFPQTMILSYGESALYLSTMGDPVTGVAPYAYVKSLFEEQRLPYELGWSPPAVPVTLASLAAMSLQLNIATGEPLPEGLTITESTLKLAFSGYDPVTGLLENVTHGLG